MPVKQAAMQCRLHPRKQGAEGRQSGLKAASDARWRAVGMLVGRAADRRPIIDRAVVSAVGHTQLVEQAVQFVQ